MIRKFARGTDLVRVKIFDARGVVVYATDRDQLGLNKSESAGVINAIKGRTASERVHRDKFSDFDNEIRDRELVSSYVPVNGSTGVEAVVEIYTDRTSSYRASLVVWRWLALLFSVVLAAVLGAVLWAVARMAALLRRTEAEQAQLIAKHRDKHDELLSQEQKRLDLLQVAAHEMQSPINQIQVNLQQMKVPLQTGDMAQLCLTVGEQASVLQRRIRDLNTLVQLNGGVLPVDEAEFHLGELLRRLGERLRTAATGRSVNVLVHISAQVDRNFSGDQVRLEEVLCVMLDAALQATENGSIQLRVHQTTQGVEFDVLDTGVSPMNAPNPSPEAAQQAPSSLEHMNSKASSREVVDLSLGCVIAEGLARAMGGRLVAQSSPGRGTWRTLRLPLKPGIQPHT
jgi:signal transduction histidine kinase